jgi:tetratricopeptide (TPR) repeat protein
LLWGIAFMSVGGLVGFLFGIPRTLAGSAAERDMEAKKVASGKAAYRVNTNLERVSDWLTQIIVGGTVTQLALFPNYLSNVGDYFTRSLGLVGPGNGPWPLVGATAALYFLIVGLLASYLITRLYLSAAIQRADDPSIEQVAELLKEDELLALEAAPIRYGNGDGKFDVEAKLAAEKILPLDLAQLTNWRDLRVWAKAQLAVGHPEDAIKGYVRAFEIVPHDAEASLGYAIALSRTDSETTQILTQLEAACNAVMPSTPLDLRKNIYLSLMYRLLYLRKPESFNRVLEKSREYFASPKAIPSGSILFNVACAFGQAFTWLKNESKRRLRQSELSYRPFPDETDDLYLSNSDALTLARGRALETLRIALERRPELKLKLQQMLDSTSSGQTAEDPKLFPAGASCSM